MSILPLGAYPFGERPMISAHRGDTSAGARENSLEAVEAAIVSRADMIELDVQWTADEIFVCHHDEMLESGNAIHDLTFKEIWKSNSASSPTVPLLSIIELVKKRCYFNLEIKEYSSRDPKRFMGALNELVNRTGIADLTLYSSFRIEYIQNVGGSIPSVIIHPDITMERFFQQRAYKQPQIFGLNGLLPSELLKLAKATSYACQLQELDERKMNDIKLHNIMLSVYTISNEHEFRTAIALGAKALVCERPSEFVRLRDLLFPSL